MLSCLGDSAIPVKDRMDDPRLCLDEVITMSGQRWRLTRVGQVNANLSGAGLRIGWLLAHQATILDPNAIRCTYVASLSAHRGRAAARCMCFCSSRGFRHLYDFLPALVGADSGNRNLRRQISARSTLPEC